MLEESGIPFNPAYIVEGERGLINALAMAKELLSLDDPPTAIFAACDTQAIGVLDTAQEMGIKVPEKLSVIGYDNIRDSEYNNLTTIDQNLCESGVIGTQMLLELLENPQTPPRLEYVSLCVVRRNTTAPPPS